MELQEKAAVRQQRRRERELQAIADAKELLRVAEGVRQLREENKEQLERAKKWFSHGGLQKIFKAWKVYVKENLELRATARCNGWQSKGGCCWHCWPWSCRCCCCTLPQPGVKKKTKKLKKRRKKKKQNRIADYKTGAAKA